jgi:hypothetical protein
MRLPGRDAHGSDCAGRFRSTTTITINQNSASVELTFYSQKWNMSLAQYKLGAYAEAIRHAEHALTILEQIEDPSVQKVRAKLATWREQTNT